jgi:membrane-bound serine protease (ClpP class)
MPLHPDAALILLMAGIALIFWELNRPGSILPGALGLLAVLFAISSLTHTGLHLAGASLVAIAVLLLALGLRRTIIQSLSAVATIFLSAGFWLAIVSPSNKIHAATSTICGLLIGIASTRLARIARVARRNKGLD